MLVAAGYACLKETQHQRLAVTGTCPLGHVPDVYMLVAGGVACPILFAEHPIHMKHGVYA